MKRTILSIVVLAIALVAHAAGFVGSTYENGKSYYLFNVYQQKFVKSATSDAITLGSKEDTPLSITISNGKWQTYTLAAVEEGYNLKTSDGKALMFDAGTSCTTGSLTESFNADKAIWKLITADEYNTYKAKKRFSVAALNVDGMPKEIKIMGLVPISLNDDAKEEAGATAIGKKLKTMGWDVVGLSEDFNFHSQIWNEAWNNGVDDASKGIYHYNATTHRGKIETSATAYARIVAQKSPVFDIDGLCLFYKCANVNQSLLESSESWTAWNEHYGYTGDGADGLIDKGYRYYAVRLADGTEFDLYIMHMDAETSDKDNAARETQITQLVNAIKASKNGRPIIVMGDTNCRYTRDKLQSKFIDVINADTRFTVKDPWIDFGRNGVYPTWDGTNNNSIMVGTEGYRKGEVVDKIFYINNTESDIRIEAETYCQDLSFINDSNEPLADHWPAVAEFSYHTYDPAIDDATEGAEGTYYLRNVETGLYLKAGGQWGTHAVVGDYGTAMNISLADGKYTLLSSFGKVFLNSEGEPYMDGSSAQQWDATQKGNYYVLSCQNGALAVTDTKCEYGPNKKVVGISALNADDPKQQWELLSANDLRIEMLGASENKPYNSTHMLSGANFDNGDSNIIWDNTITNNASKMHYNLGSTDSGIDDSATGNRVGEVFVDSYSGSTTYETRWDISQTITGIPNGRYRVTCQGFYRVAYNANANTDKDKVFYATSGGNTVTTVLNCMYDLKQTAVEGSTTNNNYKYPNSMAEAAAFFNAGYYPNELTINVTDGTLKVAVAKQETSKKSSVWVCFDNFQIYYLGDGDQNYQEETLIEDGDMLVLKGTWTDKQNDLDKVLAKKSYQAVKLTEATIGSPLEINNLGNNALIYAKAGTTSNTQNVIVDGKCSNLVITDKVNFKALDGFSASQVTYNRNNVKGYNTVCLPFDYEAEDLGSVYSLQRIYNDDQNITTLSFAEEIGTVAAGTPVLAYTEDENWRLKLTDKGVVASPVEASGTNALIGSFVKETIGTGYYKLNSTGTEFTKSTAKSTVTPFRFYVDATGVDAKSISFQFESGEETSLEEILQNPETKVTETYDLLGRKVLKVTTPGIYVRDGKKVMMK